jgi:pimeloyl-ACP methyl ester carboxylesterase
MVLTGRRWRRAAGIAVLTIITVFVCQLVAVRGIFAPSRSVLSVGGTAVLVGVQGHRMAGRAYLGSSPVPVSRLVVVIHGDAPFVRPGYHYHFASALADRLPGTRVVAILRPGYADPYGGRSDGDRGFAVGDNYTRAFVDQLAAAISLLRSRSPELGTMLVGHSGGAALSADVALLYPGLVTRAFLVGCPCDVPAFRRHMARAQWNPLWLVHVNSISPLQTLEGTQSRTSVIAISGSTDPIKLPEYAERYVSRARQLGMLADMIVLPDRGHEILNDPAVLERIGEG